MNNKFLASLTNLETLLKHRQILVERDNFGHSADHPLFNKGFMTGVEAILSAISESAALTPKLESPTNGTPDDK